ncbi:MAG: response regulator [Gemmatimonadota bacterium]
MNIRDSHAGTEAATRAVPGASFPDSPHPTDKLRAAMAERFAQDSTGGVAGHPVAGLVTLILFMDSVGTRDSLIWFGILLAAAVVRAIVGWRIKNALDRPLESRGLAFRGAVLVGAAWGIGGLLFGLQLPGEEVGFLLVIMAGLVAAATATLVADKASFYGFSTILLGSVFISAGIRGLGWVNPLDPSLCFGLMALVLTFWVIMSVLHRRANHQLEDSLRIRLELRRAQERYQGLVESARDLVWQVDNEGRWTFLNAAAEEIYGRSPEDLMGEVALDRADPDHLERDYAAFGKVLMGSELVDHETVHLSADGSARYLSFSATPLRDPGGEIRGAQGTARDVTDRVEAREALQEVARKNSLVRSLINGTEDMIFFKDGEGKYQGCNYKYAEFLGRSEEEIVGKTDEDLVGSERATAYRKTDIEALTSWDPVKFDEWVVDREGRRRLWETVKTVFRHVESDHLGLLGVVRDVTERKEAEERMRELAERAERATRMKSAFLANMSHEIRTPMNGVLGMTEILLDTELTDEQLQYLKIIRSSGESLLGVLNDILDISKIEAGHLELEEVSFDLSEEVLGAVALFSHTAVEKGSELMVDLRPEVPRGVMGDPVRLRQVLSNLVGNAVKFTPEGEILVSVTLAENGEGDPAIRFSVKDTGVGIPEEKQDAIFQEFTQADSSTTREYGGTGLGLTISRHLVSLMGGELRLESAEGQGSEFFFTLRLPVDHEYSPRAEPGDRVDLAGVRALIVDDLETNRRIFRDFLESAGAQVHGVAGAAEALDLLRMTQGQDPFNFAILDLLMPGRDGLQLAEDIRLDPELRDLPLMILTSSNRPGDRKAAARLHVNGFLQKPVSRAELLRGVNAILQKQGKEEKSMSAASGRPVKEEAASASRDLIQGLRVLVAEDNLVNQQVAKGLLDRWGCQVTVVANGIEAIDALEASSFDLVLMDVQMPEMDGLEATVQIRRDRRFSSVPIVALTAHVLPQERQKCQDVGMDDYVPKPFKPGELRERVEHWANQARTRKDDGDLEEAVEPTTGTGVEEENEMTDEIRREDLGASGMDDPPVLLEEFRSAMRDAGIESVVDAAVAAYVQEAPGRMEALESAAAAEDWDAVQREAHGMKSGARNIRADHFGALLESAEHAGRDGRGDDVNSVLPELRTAYQQVMDYLKAQGMSPE